MPYQNQTNPNDDNADVAESSSFLPLGQEETTTKKMKKNHSIAVVAGGVAVFMLLAIAGGYYSLDTVAAPAPASDSGSISITSNKFDSCVVTAGNPFRGVSLHGWQEDHAFQTCYADGSPTSTTQCWSGSFYYSSFWLHNFGRFDGWYMCEPAGDGWVSTDPLPDGSCGLPCTMFHCDCRFVVNPDNCC